MVPANLSLEVLGIVVAEIVEVIYVRLFVGHIMKKLVITWKMLKL